MIHHRLRCLRMPASAVFVLSLFCLLNPAAAQQNPPSPQQPPQPAPHPSATPQQPPQQTPPKQQPQNPQNPFENVPEAAPEKPNPSNNIKEAKPAPVGANIIEEIDFRGQHKVPQDLLRAMIYTKKGDVYDEQSIHRDFIALW